MNIVDFSFVEVVPYICLLKLNHVRGISYIKLTYGLVLGDNHTNSSRFDNWRGGLGIVQSLLLKSQVDL